MSPQTRGFILIMNTPPMITITKQENGWFCAVAPAGTPQVNLVKALEEHLNFMIPENSDEVCHVEESGGSIVFSWLAYPTAV